MDFKLRAFAILFVFAASSCSGGGGSSSLPAAPTGGNEAAAPPPTAAISELPISPGDSGPTAIAVALDGNPWFLTNAAVNRMMPSGAVTQFTDSRFHEYNSGTDIIVGPDRALWFTANCAVMEVEGPCDQIFRVKLVRITTAGAMTVESNAGDTSEGTFQSALTNGANDTIWAAVGLGLSTGSNGGGYEEVNASNGAILIGPTHLPPSCVDVGAAFFYGPGGIARGGDGGIYLTGASPCAPPLGGLPSAVLRVDPSTGAITNTFTLPDANHITEGSDGDLWITQNGATNAIARLTPSGAVTEFALPTANAGPNEITLGNDGAIWFTERTANKIGRITVSGAITEYATPTPNADPYGIASLPGECAPGHGDIWFTEAGANKIGRITF